MAQQARPGPYVDQSLTQRGPYTQDGDPVTPAPSNANTTGQTSVYDVAGTDHTPDNSDAPAVPAAPASWKPGRDPYKNQGMVGQDFFG